MAGSASGTRTAMTPTLRRANDDALPALRTTRRLRGAAREPPSSRPLLEAHFSDYGLYERDIQLYGWQPCSSGWDFAAGGRCEMWKSWRIALNAHHAWSRCSLPAEWGGWQSAIAQPGKDWCPSWSWQAMRFTDPWHARGFHTSHSKWWPDYFNFDQDISRAPRAYTALAW
jgi:hypothetical protein